MDTYQSIRISETGETFLQFSQHWLILGVKDFYYHFAVKSKVMQMTTCNQEFLCFFIQVLHSTVLHALHCKVFGLDHSRATFQAFVLFVVLEQ